MSLLRLALLALSIVLLLGIGSAVGAVIYVPDNFPTIQAALDASVQGDTVIVRDGTYVENILCPAWIVNLESENGPAATVLDGNQAGSVVTYIHGRSSHSLLQGFTITNGRAKTGAGIYCFNGSPFIRNNVIWRNFSDSGGGGIACVEASPLISANEIRENGSDRDGGGILCSAYADPIIEYNTIATNRAVNKNGGGIYCNNTSSPLIVSNAIRLNKSGWDGAGIHCAFSSAPTVANNIIVANDAYWNGGGICCAYASSPTITNNTIVKNSAWARGGGGIACRNNSEPVIRNTIVWSNKAPLGAEIANDSSSQPDVAYCDVKGGWSGPGAGNIQADPLFVNARICDLHLTYGSPCRDSGDSFAPGLQSHDFEVDKRTSQGSVDMGADEFYPHLYTQGGVVAGTFVNLRVIGMPGAWVRFALGSGIQYPAVQTKFGPLYLQKPAICNVQLGKVPADGVLRKKIAVPVAWTPGTEWYSQAMVGPVAPYRATFTNLFMGTVE